MIKKLCISLIALLAGVTALAQATIRVDVHNIVEVSERFNVVFVVEGEHGPSDFSWEPGEDFTLVWGPQKGSSTSISMVNGKTTRSSQTSYTYILQARRAGTFTLPAATATVRGNEIRSRSVEIQVLDNGSKSSSGSQASGGSAQSSEARSGGDDIFMRLVLSRNKVVVGEPVTATLKIYNKANLSGFENAKFPSFNGFWSSEVEAPQNINFQREQVGGQIYNAAVLRRWTLIPQKTGDLTIEPSEVICLVNVRRQRTRTGSLLDDFFENDYMTVRSRVTTPAQTVHVSALPSGAPASFGGGVGSFHVSARLSKDTLKTHDAASLIVTVSGKGNVTLLSAPKISFPPDFEVYDVKTTTSADKGGTSGSKTFEYPFIPRSPGEFSLAPVQYGYYDIAARRYQVASTDSLHLKVSRSAGAPASVEGSQTLVVDRKGVKNLGEDIHYIRTKTDLVSEDTFLIGKPRYWVMVALLCAMAAALWLGLRKLAARRADVSGSRKRQATRQALRRLSQAGDFLKKDLYTAFYEELHRALVGFVTDKLGMDMAQQTQENIAEALKGRGVSEEVALRFTALLEACEFARYAPSEGHEAMNAHYEEALSVITAIDASMKQTPSTKGVALAALLLMLVPLGAEAAQADYPDSLFRSGVEAYAAGDYPAAVQAWEGVLETGLRSKDLLYNLGNAYFKSEQLGSAIVSYERALRMDPSDADVRYNLDFARATTQDRIDEVPEFILKTWGRKLCYALPGNLWAGGSLLLLAVTLALVLLFLLGGSERSRRWGFFGGIVALLLTLLSAHFAHQQLKDARRSDEAVVMRSVTTVQSAPASDASKTLFILHEGTKVRLLDRVSGYSQIELSDGRQGWIKSGDIEVI